MTRDRILIRGASVLGVRPRDVLIEDGTVVATGEHIHAEGAKVHEAAGHILLPGLVDLHTHLREPGRESAETIATGSRAAALGGFTAVHAMANTNPVADTAAVVEEVWRRGREAGHCDVRPVGAVTVDLSGERLADLRAMAESDAGVRIFSDDGRCVADPMLMRQALEQARELGGVIVDRPGEVGG